MIKICGAGLIIFACSALSQKRIKKNKTSVNALNSLISALKEMADNISFFKKPLPEIMESLKENKDDVFFKKVVRHLLNDEKATVSEAWEKALKEDSFLPQEAKDALAVLGRNLGKQPAQQEAENIAYCLRELEDILKENEELFKKNTKMIKSFGILSGLMIIILFV